MANILEGPMLKCHTRTRSPNSPPPRSPRPPNPPPWPVKKKKKKKEGRKKGEMGPLPSNKHPDIEQPSLAIVERALKPFKGVTKRWSVKYLAPPPSAYHDEQGQMFAKGSRGGRYLGEVYGGLPHGVGQHWVPTKAVAMKGKEHLLYEGDFEFGLKTGNGIFYYLNGQEYRGGVLKGIHHGRGAMRYTNGDIYHGDWWKSRRHGLGAFYYHDGATYIGRFTKDNRDGWGTNYWPDRRRKYEGEWNGDDPICGRWSTMTAKDFDMLADNRLHWPPALEDIIKDGYPQEQVQVPFQGLRYPESVYFSRTCAMRHKRMEGVNIARMILRRNEGRQVGSLRAEQMEALWHAFDEINPGYYRRTKMHFIHLRRLILLARLDPDNEMGKVLFKKFLDSAIATNGLTFNNFMHIIQAFHEPVATNACTTDQKQGCCV
ncbi:hypothetical protein KC19_9G098700 [Ceratodon purpureus]|uniref:Uncharacterized protein n=1 Tax=Ceratodon purpureus TaxID=3225 RepID=A0A8T0GSG4_CERPU|nr:hypothetical protein KC19_9G098700 [Ceratodon purpureus]